MDSNKKIEKYTKKELEIFSTDLLNDFEMMKIIGGLIDSNTNCQKAALCGNANPGCKENCDCNTQCPCSSRLLC